MTTDTLQSIIAELREFDNVTRLDDRGTAMRRICDRLEAIERQRAGVEVTDAMVTAYAKAPVLRDQRESIRGGIEAALRARAAGDAKVAG